MADNTTLNSGSGGDVIASDDISSVKHQRVKIEVGADGTAVDCVPVSNGMDVTGAAVQAVGLVAQFDDVSVGTVTENQFAPVRMSTRRALLVEGVASGTAVPVSLASLPALAAGSNNIGDVDILSIAAGDNNIGNVDVVTLPALAAGTNNIGDVDVLTVPADPFGANADAASETGSISAKLRFIAATGIPVTSLPTLAAVTTVSTVTNVATIGTSVTPGTAAANLGKAEDAAHTTGDVGVMALAVRAAAPTERSAGPTDGDYEPLAVNERGAVWASLAPSANGGLSTFMASGSDGSSILVATAQAAKASAGNLYGYYAYNPEAAVSFVHFYNTASGSVTVGTTNPLFTIAIPAGSAANLMFPHGVAFSTAITVAATTTAGGNTAPATGVSLVVWYQ